MRVETLGDGSPEHTVVAGLHGDEPGPAAAVERILAAEPDVRRPVRFVVANERALERGVRYIDDDLNRCFDRRDAASDSHERRLAAALYPYVADGAVLDLHATAATDVPHAVLDSVNATTAALARATGLDPVADLGRVTAGTMLAHGAAGVAVECGRRSTLPDGGSGDADRTDGAVAADDTGGGDDPGGPAGGSVDPATVERATAVISNFLAARGVLDRPFETSEPTLYEAFDAVRGRYDFLARNFERVGVGEVYARGDGGPLRAETAFYPVLMSSEGYREQGLLGFRARRVGPLPVGDRRG